MPYTYKHGDRPLEGLTVQRAVGRGGFGEVYYALMDSGKQVALKYLRENPEIELRGIGHVMNLKSPHLITIYDVKESAAGDPFVIMEYVSGPSLRDLLVAEPGGVGVQKAAFFLKGICRGLSYLHERGIVHRDLKPANIFYDDGYVKIGDYGLSKHMTVSKHSGQTVSVGTVHYMAPEIGSGSYTQAIDVYALGVILYEMLTGRLPYTGSSMAEILMRHLRDQPDLSGIPAPFAQVIAKALAKDPKDRYQSADEMLAVVMDSDQICASVDSFDAASLTQVPRIPDAMDPDRTQTATPGARPVPALDAREALPRGELPERLQKRIDRFSRKLEQKIDKLEKRFGPRHRREAAAWPHGHAERRKGRKGHFAVLALITVAISFLLGLVHDGNRTDPPSAVVIGLYIVLGTIGVLLAQLKLLKNVVMGNVLLDRLALASVTGAFLLLAYAAANEPEFRGSGLAEMIVAPLAVLLLCDWRRRVDEGRSGTVSGSAAVWPAVIGLIAAGIGNADDAALVAAGVCAAMSLLVQSAAAMWPRPRSDASAGSGILGAHHSPLAAERLGLRPAPAEETPQAAKTPKPDEQHTAAGVSHAESAPSPNAVEAWPSVQPSFVGRTANAGVSFLGKILLLTGVVLAIGQGPFLDFARPALESGKLEVDAELRPLIQHGIPAGAVLVSLVLGSVFLLLARRSGGAGHVFVGFLGCLSVILGAVVSMGFGREGLMLIFSGESMDELMHEGRLWVPVLLTLVFVLVGVLLLLLPSRLRRGSKPIVV